MADRTPPPKLDPKEHPYVFSASQIETGNVEDGGCLRKWAFEKIDRVKKVDTTATALGTEVHGHLERYLKFGEDIDTKVLSGKIAMSGIQHLPVPKMPGMRVEEWFVRKTGVATYWGLKDAEFLQGVYGIKFPVVYDHKTCKAFSWAKTEENLQTGIQSGMYGWDAMEAVGEKRAQLRWTYMKTEGKKESLPVVTVITRTQAEDVMAKVDKIASNLIQLKKSLKAGEAIEAPANYLACGAYGGCPHRDTCKPSAQAALMAMVEQEEREMSGVLEDLKNRKKKNTGTAETSKEKIEEDKAEASSDPVNPPDRDQEPPPPPPAKKAQGKWFNAVWDEAAWEWQYPSEYKDAVALDEKEAKEKEAAAKKAEKEAKGKGSVAASKSSKESAEVSSVAAAPSLDGLLDLLADKIADRIAEKLKA